MIRKSFYSFSILFLTIGFDSYSSPQFASESLEGVDFSDHLNYWKFGYKALMITDTAFLRNKNYHQKSDTISTLNFNKIAETVRAILSLLLSDKI